jgi:hypothetical protein
MSDLALGKPQLVVRNRGGGIFTCVGGAVCLAIVAAAVPELRGPTGTASDAVLMIVFGAIGLVLLYLGTVMLSTRIEFFERGVMKRSLRGDRSMRYVDVEWLRYQSMKVQGGPVSAMRSITLIFHSRLAGANDLVAILHEGPQGLAEFAPLTAAAVDPLAARLGVELERKGRVQLACGLALTQASLDLGGVSIPLSWLSVDFDQLTGKLHFRNAGQPAFALQRDEPNMLPLLALIERRAARAA